MQAARCVLGGLFLALAAGSVHGQVYAVLQYESFYRQTLPQIPLAPYTTFVYTSLSTNCASEDVAATVTNPSHFQRPLTEEQGGAGPDRVFSEYVLATTESALFADYPSGQYLYQTFASEDPTCTDTNTFNQPFPAGGGGWPSAVPSYTAPTFSILQNFDTTVSHAMTFNTFTPFPGSTSSFISLYILDGQNGLAFDSMLSASTNTVTIPANTLQPGTGYTALLRFYAQRTQTVNFYDHALTFARTTTVDFTTRPSDGCPADLGGQGGVQEPDGQLNNNDFIVFINLFFAGDPAADVGVQGGAAGSDGQYNNNDFIAFINLFFAGC